MFLNAFQLERYMISKLNELLLFWLQVDFKKKQSEKKKEKVRIYVVVVVSRRSICTRTCWLFWPLAKSNYLVCLCFLIHNKIPRMQEKIPSFWVEREREFIIFRIECFLSLCFFKCFIFEVTFMIHKNYPTI